MLLKSRPAHSLVGALFKAQRNVRLLSASTKPRVLLLDPINLAHEELESLKSEASLIVGLRLGAALTYVASHQHRPGLLYQRSEE
jgi:hypothetical protein